MAAFSLPGRLWWISLALAGCGLATAGARVDGAWGKMPLHFEENVGQAQGDVRFLARGAGRDLFLTPSEAVIVMAASGSGAQPSVLRMALVGGAADARVAGRQLLPGKSNYFIGDDPASWHTNVPTYAKVAYSGVWPGIDLVYYGNQQQLEFDFIVAPQVDPGVIEMGFTGARHVEIGAEGNLLLHLEGGTIQQKAPVIYQIIAGVRHAVQGRYELRGPGRVGFALEAYDRNYPLVIDPVVVAYSTFLGGSGEDMGNAIAVGRDGCVYVAGMTGSADFPVTAGAVQPAAGSGQYGGTVFVSRLDPGGSLVYSTYLGSDSRAFALAVDAAGSAYVAGLTLSASFPTTPGALQASAGSTGDPGGGNAFVSKLDPMGASLVYSTYLGGSGNDYAAGIAVDAAGHAHVAGATTSADFPVPRGALQPVIGGQGDVFAAMLAPDGSRLVHATFLGGGGNDAALAVALDGAGGTYLTGFTASPDFPVTPGAFQTQCICATAPPGPGSDTTATFVARLTTAGLAYSTFLGGGTYDGGYGIVADAGGHAFVTGRTSATDFPTTAGAPRSTPGGSSDAYVVRLDPAGSSLLYSTYLGGASEDRGTGIALDAAGNAWVTGVTLSADFPVTSDALRGSLGASATFGTLFITAVNSAGTGLSYSTYFGGQVFEQDSHIARDGAGSLYVTGRTMSPDFPVTPGALQPAYAGSLDAFITRLVPAGTPAQRARVEPRDATVPPRRRLRPAN